MPPWDWRLLDLSIDLNEIIAQEISGSLNVGLLQKWSIRLTPGCVIPLATGHSHSTYGPICSTVLVPVWLFKLCRGMNDAEPISKVASFLPSLPLPLSFAIHNLLWWAWGCQMSFWRALIGRQHSRHFALPKKLFGSNLSWGWKAEIRGL